MLGGHCPRGRVERIITTFRHPLCASVNKVSMAAVVESCTGVGSSGTSVIKLGNLLGT
jgi:hypothetical protein